MTDYYAPASWEGVATYPDHPGIVVCVDVTSADRSGQDEIGYEQIADGACPRCDGERYDPLGWTLGEARADPLRYQKEWAKAKGMPNAMPLLSDIVSSIPFEHSSPDAKLLCAKCHGKGQQYREEPFVRFTWPVFQATPKGKTWHVERDSEIIKTGAGLRKCARWGEESHAVVERLVDKIEAVVTGDNPGTAQVAATGEGYTIEYERDWTWVRFANKPSEAVREALREQLSTRWGRRRRAWYIKEHVEAETIIAVIASATD